MGCVTSSPSQDEQTAPDPQIVAFKLYGPCSIAESGSETPTSSAVFHHTRYADRAAREEFNTRCGKVLQPTRLHDLSLSKLDAVAIKYRRVRKIVNEKRTVGGVTKLAPITYFGRPICMTYRQLWGTVEAFAKGLRLLGVQAGAKVCLFEDTRWEWIVSAYSIWLQHNVAVTVHANLGEEALCYALRETECSAIICNGASVEVLLKSVAVGLIPPCVIIYLDSLEMSRTPTPDEAHGCTVVNWLEVAEKGLRSDQCLVLPTDPDELALIMYTSGTTGDPKGVMHSHGSLTIAFQNIHEYLENNYKQVKGDLYMAYLPLAHITSFCVLNVFLGNNTVVCFGSAKTLTNLYAKPKGDMMTFKPTLIMGVPRIFDKIVRTLRDVVVNKGACQRRLFAKAYQARLKALHRGKDTPLYNLTVFYKYRLHAGGNLRLIFCGGGPLSVSTKEFMSVVIGKMVCGWGLTETACIGAAQRVGDTAPDVVGQPFPSSELKLVDTEDYKHTDSPEPRGELCIRGPFLFKGYYKQPELTKEAIDEDGWFHTGDVGSVSADGRISVIGRIKALAKNCLGEYIALETLESIYAGHPLVLNNCICVIVHPDRNYIGAVLVTDDAKLSAFIAQHHIQVTASDPAKDKAVHRKVVEKFVEMAKEAKRQPFEFIKKVIIVRGEWTPENDVLTAATKLKRRVIDVKYAEEIKELFAGE
eukprot:gene10725-7455_t